MENKSPLVITISRLLGSGGSYIGQQLANKMGIFYADRVIVSEAAKKLSLLEEDLEFQDEKVSSIWQSYVQTVGFLAPEAYSPPFIMPTDRQLFEIEAEIIERTAKECSAVIIGRCGSYVLRDHPNHVSIFLHSDFDTRATRLQQIYDVSKNEAAAMIAQSDKERAHYFYSITGRDRTDSLQYDFCINTTRLGLDQSVEAIFNYLTLLHRPE